MSKSFKKDLTGQRFGRLTVIEFVPTDKKSSYWKCKCDCGSLTTVRADALLESKTLSCGCIKKEQGRKNLTKHHSHLQSGKRIYHEWQNIKARCLNTNNKSYYRYGGRGITICDEWKDDFQAFYDWAMSHGYKDDLTIDRIDNNKGYNPENCRWVDLMAQNRNRRSNVMVEYNGQKICLTDAAKLSGIAPKTALRRYKAGDRGDRLFRPVRK